MTGYSRFYTCEICPNCDELNDTQTYGELGSRHIETDASEGAP